MKNKLSVLLIGALTLTMLFLSACGKKQDVTDSEGTDASTASSLETEGAEPAKEDLEYGINFNTTWGDLYIWCCGELPQGKLSETQRSLILYPKFDREYLCLDASTQTFHSVRWCYMLEGVSDIEYSNLSTAIDLKYQPCDKCIKPIN